MYCLSGTLDVYVNKTNNVEKPQNFKIAPGEKWKKGDTLTYKVIGYTDQLTKSEVHTFQF